MAESSQWTSLEIAKLVVGGLTPIAVVVLTVMVNKLAERTEALRRDEARAAEHARWSNRLTVELLIELHKDMAGLLNDLLCFFTWVGDFRVIDPPAAIAAKRRLDKLYFTNRHLFSDELRERYLGFMDLCFAHWAHEGLDAKIRTSQRILRSARGTSVAWDEKWSGCFADEPRDPDELAAKQRRAYELTMEAFACQLGLGPRAAA